MEVKPQNLALTLQLQGTYLSKALLNSDWSGGVDQFPVAAPVCIDALVLARHRFYSDRSFAGTCTTGARCKQ